MSRSNDPGTRGDLVVRLGIGGGDADEVLVYAGVNELAAIGFVGQPQAVGLDANVRKAALLSPGGPTPANRGEA